MAYTTADRDAVKAAMLQMTTTGRPQDVHYSDGTSLTYAPTSIGQMQAVLNMIERDIAAAAVLLTGVSRMTRSVRLSPRSGY